MHAEGVRIKRRTRLCWMIILIFIYFADPVGDVAISRNSLHNGNVSFRGIHRFLSDVHSFIQ